MKRRTKVVLSSLAVLVGAPILALWLVPGGDRVVEKTRKELRAAGFKVDVREFDFSAPVEVQARVAALTNQGGMQRRAMDRRTLQYQLDQFLPGLMPMIGTNSALQIWKQERLRLDGTAARYLDPDEKWLEDDAWPLLRALFGEERQEIREAAQAAISGPIQFPLDASKGMGMLLPHLASLKQFENKFARAVVMELREGNKEAVWTNLLAASRLVTAWKPEPVEMTHLVRFAIAAISQKALWQALSAGWGDERLATLQSDWEGVDFLTALPETAAFARAGSAHALQLERAEPIQFGMTLKEVITAPRVAYGNMSYYFTRLRYRRSGSYESEREILLHYRDRETELRNAVQASSWSDMRTLPGVTNLVPFQPKGESRVTSLLSIRRVSMAFQMGAAGGGGTFLGKAAQAEARRRIIVTAIALERYRTKHGEYPVTLAKLVPQFVKEVPVDFMDGKPLRYRRDEAGSYLLYSVGTDCVDHGGVGQDDDREAAQEAWMGPGPRRRQDGDLVWPRVASEEERNSFDTKQRAEVAAQVREQSAREAERHWSWTATRQRKVNQVLAENVEPPAILKKDGILLSEMLRGSNQPQGAGFEELLLLKKVAAATEPGVMTFELGIKFDEFVKHATVGLIVDWVKDESLNGETLAAVYDCTRATNGNALIHWNTYYETPGKHALQAVLFLNEPGAVTGSENTYSIGGPNSEITVTNICQLSPSHQEFHPEAGWLLHARAIDPNASYRVRFLSREGKQLKLLEGRSTNHTFTVNWDLMTDAGKEWDRTFESVLEVTLSDSRRTQLFRLQ